MDHGGVLTSLISGVSKDRIWKMFLLIMERTDTSKPCLSWFARAASPSNLSDGPSHGNWNILERFTYLRNHPRCLINGVQMKPT